MGGVRPDDGQTPQRAAAARQPTASVLGGGAFPVWQESYLRATAERDLPMWGLPAKSTVTQRLFRMVAAEQGAILSLSKLGQSLGLSHHTVKSPTWTNWKARS